MNDTDDPIINTEDNSSSDEAEQEDLPVDVREAIGIGKKKGTKPDPTDYISELENTDFETEEDF